MLLMPPTKICVAKISDAELASSVFSGEAVYMRVLLKRAYNR